MLDTKVVASLNSTLSMTMIPFLYQTRTLSSWSWPRSKAVSQVRQGGANLRRCFMASMRIQHSVHRSSIPRTTNAGKNDGPSIRRTTNMSGVGPPSAGSWNYDPEKSSFTERSWQREEDELKIIRYKTTSTNPMTTSEGSDIRSPQTIDFDDKVDLEDFSLGDDEIYQLTDTRGERESTITPSERYAFQKIFSDIFSASETPNRSSSSTFASKESMSELDVTEVSRQKHPSNAKSKLASIFSGAMKSSLTRAQKEEAVNRYPPPLRAAAAKAIGLDKAMSDEQDAKSRVEQTALDTERLESLRDPERIRVEELMKTARSDFELWEIMEKEVFSMIPKLGLEDTPTIPVAKSKKRGKKAKILVEETLEAQRTTSLLYEPIGGISPLVLYGPLYPSHLLLGLRLLDRSFAKPSPLALSILPKIKSLGSISHVLGASTQFYNELLRIYRYRHDDFEGVMDLLYEMEHAALDMDNETYEIVVDIMKTQNAVHRGTKGMPIKALWAMPEFLPTKFNAWKFKIGQALEEREQEAASHVRY